jgi:hypothetical protein
MSWENIDWLDFELGEYQDSLNHRVHQAYNAAYRVLDDAYQAAKKKLEEDAKAPKDQEDFDLTSQIIDYEEHRWLEQQEALAAMALTLLASLTKSFLNEQKGRNLDKTHPPKQGRYAGSSELQRRITEYKERFDVDLEKIECFETVREVELARDSCVHQEGIPTEDYLKKTQKRLLDERDNISISPKILDTFIEELSRFADGLNKAMKAVRKAAQEKQEKEEKKDAADEETK